MKLAQKLYKIKGIPRMEWVENWRADLENWTGFDVTVIRYSNGKVGVGIDRAGFFIFKNMDVLMDKNSGKYIAEKLTIPESDGVCLVDFFKYGYSQIAMTGDEQWKL